MTNDQLTKEFVQRFKQEPNAMFFCPGRVNLIGEHIDYNGGRVMPAAVGAGTWLAVAFNNSSELRFSCLNFPEEANIKLGGRFKKTGPEWYNYPLGVIDHFVGTGVDVKGMDLLFFGNLPIGAGLSSSASIEVLMGYTMSQLYNVNVSRIDIALISKKTENEFMGLNCGIMDQFAVAMGEKDKAILLDCDSLDYSYIPIDTGAYALVVINSRKERKLTDSKYNERYAQCQQSLALLKSQLDIQHLCDISSEILQKNLALLNDPILEKRAWHVVKENERVKEAAQVLASGDVARFGQLMYASHDSLRDLYEVSGKELDTIVEFSKTFAGCIGARMTGAGFGGCAIALVRKDEVENYAAQLVPFYRDRVGYEPEVLGTLIGDGVRKL